MEAEKMKQNTEEPPIDGDNLHYLENYKRQEEERKLRLPAKLAERALMIIPNQKDSKS